jgi:signal transduction histidine kinase/ActR/RegA family two-component response regulator
MPEAPHGIDLGGRLARRLLPSTLLVAVLISFGLPATYYVLESRALRRTADMHAREFAESLRELVLESPRLWRYRAEKDTRLLGAFVPFKDVAALRVLDEQGRPIAGLSYARPGGEGWLRPSSAGLAPILFNGRRVATVEVLVSDERLLGVTLALLLGSSLVGIALATLVHVIPVRVMRRMERRMGELVESVQRSRTGLERQAAELASLLEFTRATGSTLDEPELFRTIADRAARACGADACSLFVRDHSGERVLAVSRSESDRPEVHSVADVPFLEEAMGSREPVEVTDPAADPRVPAAWPGRERLAALAAVPLVQGDRAAGGLVLERRSGPPFTADEIRLALTLAGQAALAVQNAGLVRNLRAALDDLSRAQQRLIQGETLRAVGELAAGMAHHLNNLLAVVMGRVQLLQNATRDPATLRALGIVERAAGDAAEVVRRVLEFTNTRGARPGVPLDLNALARDVLEMTQARWENDALLQGIHVRVLLEAGTIPPLVGEPAALREVLMNLVLNAIDAMPEGGALTLRTWAEAGDVCCAVIDTGVGMTDEVRERAFQPFFTTKGVKSPGLGLSTSYSIVRRHGGELTLDSAPGRGTTVTMRLPVRRAAAGPARAAAAGAPATAPLVILAVDDSAEARDLLEDILQALGHRVVTAANGREALACLDGGLVPDLVLTDLGMPGLNGWQVARGVKARHPRLPVVLLTGWGEEPPRLADHRDCIDAVLPKPFDQRSLRNVLARLTAASSASIQPTGR